MIKPVKAAVVGISGYGASYLNTLLNHPAVVPFELVGVADPASHRCPHLDGLQRRDVAIFESQDELIAARPDVELVMIATPIHLHARQTCSAIDAGASVLVEKPLAGSLADANRILEADRIARQCGRFVAVGYQWSFSSAVQALKADILAGKLGRPKRMRAWVSFPRDTSYFARNGWAGRILTDAGDAVYDSPANNATAHYLHNMLYLLGASIDTAARPVDVTAELYRANPIENYDTAAIRATLDNGAELLFYTTHATTERSICAIYEFENATVRFDPSGQFLASYHDNGVVNYGNPDHPNKGEKIWQSLASVRTGAPVVCGPTAAIAQTLVIAAAQQSAGDVVNFPADLIHTVPTAKTAMYCVKGLAETMRDCYNAAVLPSERHVSWARAGERTQIADLLESTPRADRIRAVVQV